MSFRYYSSLKPQTLVVIIDMPTFVHLSPHILIGRSNNAYIPNAFSPQIK